MSCLALTLSYDGAAFAGSQVQPGQRTVQGELQLALNRLFGGEIRTVFAGRTDRGVHAAGQVVSCLDGRPEMPVERIQQALNAQLPADVAVVGLGRRSDDFHARFDARWREYRYRLWSGPRAPLARREVWHRRGAMDLGAMAAAAASFVGQHDFASLTGGGEGVPWSSGLGRRGTVRTVLGCSVAESEPWWTAAAGPAGRLYELRVVADGFLPQMVRNIVSVIAAVGSAKRPVEWVDQLLAQRDRRAAEPTAPPQGLTFWRVGYDVDGAPDAGVPAR